MNPISDHKHLFIPISLTLLTAVIMVLPEQVNALLSYRRAAVPDFHWWPFLTANLIHSNWLHWLVNLGGLWILWRLFFDSFRPKQWLVVLAILAVSNILFVHWFTPRIVNYVGMSGALHGMICVGFIAKNYLNPVVSVVGTLVVIAKIVHENWFQTTNTMAELIGRNVAVEAHMHGVIVGIVIGILIRCQQEEWILRAKT